MECTHYESSTKCRESARVWIQKDGKDVPGCWYCNEHAKIILDEYSQYRELLGNFSSRLLTESEMI